MVCANNVNILHCWNWNRMDLEYNVTLEEPWEKSQNIRAIVMSWKIRIFIPFDECKLIKVVAIYLSSFLHLKANRALILVSNTIGYTINVCQILFKLMAIIIQKNSILLLNLFFFEGKKGEDYIMERGFFQMHTIKWWDKQKKKRRGDNLNGLKTIHETMKFIIKRYQQARSYR